ncbi:MAG: helix-turn-helix transcriptional regulator [Atopobiaceae bacterium]|nr:helix-turn-helix transcriptional regulator [Atopobiaceae bacterium]
MDIERNRVTGNCLRKLRRDAGLTQTQLAARLHKTQSFVSKVENAERELSLVESFSYAQALRTSYKTLITMVYTDLMDADLYADLNDSL